MGRVDGSFSVVDPMRVRSGGRPRGSLGARALYVASVLACIVWGMLTSSGMVYRTG